ncbi:MAG: tRNA epoxyqueuosine(34) reductase QueG [Rikenellaceae bacterium]|nr:tRNA epoxyqueuosine(34) reductase QueG [Rikenellaceae bacterium]
MLSRNDILHIATEVGFDLCGIASCRHLATNEAWFTKWLSAGYQSSLSYLERNIEKRFDPRLLVENARTVVVCAVSYKNRISEGYAPDDRAKIASYACSRDYHTTIRSMLDCMLRQLREQHPDLQGRAFVDTAPLAEKQLAVEAGLGWIGRQSLLITPQYGSYVLLGELILCDETDSYDSPFANSRCGNCNACIEHCPTGALVAPYTVDTSRCIACHTIEKEPSGTIDLNGWIFGCDNCQSCCPYNRHTPQHRNKAFDLLFDPLAMSPTTWQELSPEEFKRRMGETPLTRSGLDRIKQNAIKNQKLSDI